MKYILAIGLAVMIIVSLFVWRIKPGVDDRGRTALVWATDDSPARRQQVELFEKLNPDIGLTTDPGNFLIEKMIVQSLAGIGPDLFDASGVYVLERLVQSGVAMDLTDVAKANGFDEMKIWPGAVGNIKLSGRQYAFPGNVYSNVIFYNKNVFDKYGEAYPPREMSWSEFVEIGRRLTRLGADGRQYECFGAMNLYWYELVLQAGGRIYSPDGVRCVLDSPEAIEAMEFYRGDEELEGQSLPGRYGSRRSIGTAIYFLLTAESCSMMHRIKSDEIFHFYMGDPVTMLQLYPEGSSQIVTLGSDLLKNEKPQVIVPKDIWQGSFIAPGGSFALLGTTVAPGFDFADFEYGRRKELIERYPNEAEKIIRLTRESGS